MIIVMHCGGMPFNGETINKQSLGGSETAAYYMAKELARIGHEVTLFTNSNEEGRWDGVQYRWAGRIDERHPLGEIYQVFVAITPHDVNITQRHPSAFIIPTAAKINLWWLHDMPLPQLHQAARMNMVSADGILAVSEFQKQALVDTWDINPAVVHVIGNGVDLGLFKGNMRLATSVINMAHEDTQGYSVSEHFNLLYSSRPERGLETLVKPGGVMELLAERLSHAHLYVCGYDNVTEPMRAYYDWLNARCDALPNVTRLGHLTKQELADVMRQCDLLAYPTTFSETSCITAMEAMAAGLPMVSTAIGALPETCDGAGVILLPAIPAKTFRPGLMEAGDASVQVDEQTFADVLVGMASMPEDERQQMIMAQLRKAELLDWSAAAQNCLGAIEDTFAKVRTAPSVMRHYMRNSDIYALKDFAQFETIAFDEDGIEASTRDELNECYAFTKEASWDEHYAKYYEYEKNRGVNYGPETLDGNNRFEYVAGIVGHLPACGRVLDYGCAHGHYTVNLAKRYPNLEFVGVDITPSNVAKAQQWAREEGLDNVRFIVGRVSAGALRCGQGETLALGEFDGIIAAEVLEHMANPQECVDTLGKLLNDGPNARVITTTPYGPWEAMGYEQHWPWRAHVHHFERADLKDMFGMHPNYRVTVVASGRTPEAEPLGSFVCVFGKPNQPCGEIDYERKHMTVVPRQTLSLCMIVKNSSDTIASALRSVAHAVDEFIIAIDQGCTDSTERIINEVLDEVAKHKPRILFNAASPLEVGFDEARNATLHLATGDWVLWMDADERIEGAENLHQYLRNNQYNAYAIPHHHFSLEPAGLLKTDYPTRIFRNNIGVRFIGVVHEHPETGLNEGIQHVAVINNVVVAHYGYVNEETRRKRFDRNYPLLVRDRAKYPERHLGKFLWLRDLFQITRYEMEAGSLITPEMVGRANEAIALWEDLVINAPLRMPIEAMEWYSGMVQLIGVGVKKAFAVKSEKGENEVAGVFFDERHANMLAARMMKEV